MTPPLPACAIAAPVSTCAEVLPGAHALGSDASFWELHEELQPLGKGYFGRVHLAMIKASGTLAAVKVVDKASGRSTGMDYRNEPQLLHSMRHPNIVELLATYQSPCSLFIVMRAELGGDLLTRASLLPGGLFAEEEAHRHMVGLLRAVEHLHAHGVVHRDIKPSNLLLSPDGEVRLADFGLSDVLPPSGVLTTVCGTHDFLAPEMIRCGHGEVDGYGLEVDMWGVGLLLFVLLHGHNPFERGTEIETLQAILLAQYQIPETVDVCPAAKDLIYRLLVCDPAKRCKASDALRHEWLARTWVSAASVCDTSLAIRRPCAMAERLGICRARASSDCSNRRSRPPCVVAERLSMCM